MTGSDPDAPQAPFAVREAPGSVTVVVRAAARNEPRSEVAIGVWAWLELFGAVAFLERARGAGFQGLGAVVAFTALAGWTVLGLALVRSALRRRSVETLHIEPPHLWHELRGPFGTRTSAHRLEALKEIRLVAEPGPGPWTAIARHLLPGTLALDLGGRAVRAGYRLDRASAEAVLGALRPWLERNQPDRSLVAPGAALLAAVTPTPADEGCRACARCGTALAADAAQQSFPLAWCDGCGAWLPVSPPEPPGVPEILAQVLHARGGADDELLWLLPLPSPRERRRARVLRIARIAGAVIVRVAPVAVLVGLAVRAWPGVPVLSWLSGRIALFAIFFGVAAGLVWLATRVVAEVFPRPVHGVRLTPTALIVEWNHGWFARSLELPYDRLQSIRAEPARRAGRPGVGHDSAPWRVRIRGGARARTLAGHLDRDRAIALAATVRAFAARAARSSGSVAAWVPRYELRCPSCRAELGTHPALLAGDPPQVACGPCQHTAALEEMLRPRLDLSGVGPVPEPLAALQTRDARSITLRVATTPSSGRWKSVLVRLAVAVGVGAVSFMAAPLGYPTLAWVGRAGALAALLAVLRALDRATGRGAAITVTADTLLVERKRILVGSKRRWPIERVLAVETQRVTGSPDDEAGPLFRVSLRLRAPGPFVALSHRISIGEGLSADDAHWVATVLDRLIFQTALG